MIIKKRGGSLDHNQILKVPIGFERISDDRSLELTGAAVYVKFDKYICIGYVYCEARNRWIGEINIGGLNNNVIGTSRRDTVDKMLLISAIVLMGNNEILKLINSNP